MNDTGIKEIVIKEIIELAQQHGLEKVVLFGYRDRGDYHRASDIDLAVYGGDITGFSLDVEENTSTLLTYDIVDMKKAGKPAFVDAISKKGKILYEKV
ncbi:MAG: nucleotidyltransferase domain-containing protein [Lachnospiraceae bacterium]|nr:nucleotidyltransferase domain-containing protein [Lachnospiraceae bacterium]